MFFSIVGMPSMCILTWRSHMIPPGGTVFYEHFIRLAIVVAYLYFAWFLVSAGVPARTVCRKDASLASTLFVVMINFIMQHICPPLYASLFNDLFLLILLICCYWHSLPSTEWQLQLTINWLERWAQSTGFGACGIYLRVGRMVFFCHSPWAVHCVLCRAYGSFERLWPKSLSSPSAKVLLDLYRLAASTYLLIFTPGTHLCVWSRCCMDHGFSIRNYCFVFYVALSWLIWRQKQVTICAFIYLVQMCFVSGLVT